MGDDFKTYFQSQIAEEIDFGPVMRFSLKRNDKNIERFIFVEGSTDEQFYGSTQVEILCDKTAYFYRKMTDDDSLPEYKGKEAVFYALKKVCRNEQLASEIDRCLFIVDRDFSDHISSTQTKLNATEYSRILITYGHSMESYFLEKNNVTVILEYFNADVNRFWELFSCFAEEMSPYYALNAVITENYHTVRYRKTYTNDDICTFDFKKGDRFWDGYDAMIEECRLMRSKIRKSQNSVMLQRATFLETKIRHNPRYIRGHDAYTFLEQYLRQFHNVDISFNNHLAFKTIKPLIARFEVQLLKNSARLASAR